MRELKFRAWDRDCKGYCCGVDIGNLLTGLAYNNGRKSEIVKDKILAEHFILEQYTGLKDKNGKEIYEGDIVSEEFEYDGEKAKTIWQVRWCDDECAFELHYARGFEIDDCSLDAGENYEVVGNIHENPELLEEE